MMRVVSYRDGEPGLEPCSWCKEPNAPQYDYEIVHDGDVTDEHTVCIACVGHYFKVFYDEVHNTLVKGKKIRKGKKKVRR